MSVKSGKHLRTMLKEVRGNGLTASIRPGRHRQAPAHAPDG